jgi:hypothetical protein
MFYVRDRGAKVWCVTSAPNVKSLCGKRAKGHAWPHTERELPEGEKLCAGCERKATSELGS